jgi:hypothetical protein
MEMGLDLKLPDLSSPSLSEILLRKPLAALIKIKTRNEERWGAGIGSRVFENRKEKLRKQLQSSDNPKEELKNIQATEIGWQRLLLSLYIESNGQDWLPAFDDDVASSLLGNDGTAWTASRRRQAVTLFFERFDTLPGLVFLATQLRSAFDNRSTVYGAKEFAWKIAQREVFQTDGPARIGKTATKGEALQQLMERHGIPSKGVYSSNLRRVYLLKSLEDCRLGEEPDTLEAIEEAKDQPGIDAVTQYLGAAALRILVERVEKEGGRKWPDAWPKWIVRLGCDPILGRYSEGIPWWRWANDSQLKLAQQAVTGLTLKFFIQFLEQSLRGTDKEPQFALRSRFLLALFAAGKIKDTRLCLNWAQLQKMNGAMAVNEIKRGSYQHYVAHLSDTTDKTSMICLKCVDDIFIVEGTHTFGLRVYRGGFPINGFWERSRKTYQDRELRLGRDYIAHDQWGRWVEKFFSELRRKHHLENNWREVKI